jgi:hypothetical protein
VHTAPRTIADAPRNGCNAHSLAPSAIPSSIAYLKLILL